MYALRVSLQICAFIILSGIHVFMIYMWKLMYSHLNVDFFIKLISLMDTICI
jgi:hypothetical protein